MDLWEGPSCKENRLDSYQWMVGRLEQNYQEAWEGKRERRKKYGKRHLKLRVIWGVWKPNKVEAT